MYMEDLSQWSLIKILMTMLLLFATGVKKVYEKLKTTVVNLYEKFTKKKETEIGTVDNNNK